ncbi:SDR family oxidoreductase [Reichenbachiella versicolor]|uniref:SDR family oxidoreductase n=1 Tax=Reichenbachiella versicolor TaxID=1821036 RepID=UPI000D6E6DBC|nr:SDR family oxidoreductase [Reichenbachiella versicolor]
MKIGVTAANGQLGTAIVKALIKEVGKENVIAIARTPKKAEHLNVEVRKGNYDSPEEFDEALKGIDRLLLVSSMDLPDKRIQQHRNVINAAKSNGVRKIVYTSIIGSEINTDFSPVVQSNRQTEKDIQGSGLEWAIGRNGIYIEPDLEYLSTYIKEGCIRNSAADGKCGYTSRTELGYAYAQLLTNESDQKIYNLSGEAISQDQLAELMNNAFGTNLKYKPVTVEEYRVEREVELGEFLGKVISGIYEGIRNGDNNIPSDYLEAASRPHIPHKETIELFKNNK